MTSQTPQHDTFDPLTLQRAVHLLSRTGVRSSLSLERLKLWVKQFHTPEEKCLAHLILRNLIFRSNNQLHSCMRQAMKKATIHFVNQLQLQEKIAWQDALRGNAGLSFYCGPPSLPTRGLPTVPAKSGDLVARHVNQRYSVDKSYPSDFTEIQSQERFIVVDDGTYTGIQLANFLRGWEIDFSQGRVAIAVAIAHTTACDHLKREFPNVPVFYGELLTEESCFESLCQRWIYNGQWHHPSTPQEIYRAVHERNQPFRNGNEVNGYGSIGALVAFEHGMPDDSIQLLWDVSDSWKPLVER